MIDCDLLCNANMKSFLEQKLDSIKKAMDRIEGTLSEEEFEGEENE